METRIVLNDLLATADRKRHFMVKRLIHEKVGEELVTAYIGLLEFGTLRIIYRKYTEIERLIDQGSMVYWQPFEDISPIPSGDLAFTVEA